MKRSRHSSAARSGGCAGGESRSPERDGGRAWRVSVVTLGCPKNLVDSEVMVGALHSAGFEIVRDPEAADLILVNTCAFITEAQQESVDAILDAVTARGSGRGKVLLVAGCLPQRHGLSLLEELPEIDYLLGPGAVGRVVEVAEGLLAGDLERGGILNGLDRLDYDWSVRVLSGYRHTAYLKVSEGCGNNCTYCVIPRLRGAQRSRPLEDLEAEAGRLAADGVVELSLIGQDTTAYGADLYGRPSLDRLLRLLDDIDGLHWIRLLYTDPRSWRREMLDALAGCRRVAPYVDMPVQHASDSILRRMGRGMSWKATRGLLEELRNARPGMSVRTTVMTGFPGETDDDFRQLLDAVAEYEFDHLGVFAYSGEDGTAAASMDNQVPPEIGEERRDRVLSVQQEISLTRNRRRIGGLLEMIVDSIDTDRGILAGRWSGQALDIDGVVYAALDWENRGAALKPGPTVRPGAFLPLRVRGAGSYDLVGSIEEEHSS